MIAASADLKICIATRPIDFRCGHDGLAAKVQEMLHLAPFSGAAFVFRSKRADRIKISVWDRTGLVLVHKRLEGCKFVWRTIADGVMRSPGRWSLPRGNLPPYQPAAPGNAGSCCDRPPSACGSRAGSLVS